MLNGCKAKKARNPGSNPGGPIFNQEIGLKNQIKKLNQKKQDESNRGEKDKRKSK